jgi:hypothetical protein
MQTTLTLSKRLPASGQLLDLSSLDVLSIMVGDGPFAST